MSYKIKGFTTKEDIPKQLKGAGVPINMKFTASKFKTKKNPFDGMEVKGSDKKPQEIKPLDYVSIIDVKDEII